jgi:glyoxylase-like metal-dependent hydrolase (beta-lactamase superfamily II)
MPFIGDIEYQFVSDGIYWTDGGGMFGVVPKVVWEKKLAPDARNRIPLALNCLLLRVAGKIVLVDTGLGDKLTSKQAANFGIDRPEGGLLTYLHKIGVAPTEVDIVINTHLHADHCGGNTTFNSETQQIVPTFPNAEYWIQRLELADASYPNERTQATYLAENFAGLEKTGQLKLLSGDTPVLGGISTVITRGHTRGHQSILLESRENVGLYVADLSGVGCQFERTAWVSAFDVEPLETIETKRRWQHWAVQTGALVMFEHDPHITTARLHRDGRHFKLEPTLKT